MNIPKTITNFISLFQYIRRGRHNDSESEESDGGSEPEEDEESSKSNNQKMAEVYRLTEERKSFLVSKICLFGADAAKSGKQGRYLSCHIDEMSAGLIVKYLSSKRPFFNSFDVYLKAIIGVLNEQSIQVSIF